MTEEKKPRAGSGFWQIAVPIGVGTALVLLMGALIVVKTGPGNLSRFAEISTVLMLLPFLFFSLIGFVFLGGSIYLVSKLIRGLPGITVKVLEVIEWIQKGAESLSQNLTGMIIQPISFLAGFRRKGRKKGTEIPLHK